MRKGDWMQTFSGRQYWPLDPRPEEVHLLDIANALSKMSRYGGHCLKFYSVAEHCVLLSQIAPPKLKLVTLMHDASEAYLVDVPRPIKNSITNYAEIENLNMMAIAKRFGFEWPMPAIVKDLDNRILLDERDQNMAKAPADWGIDGEKLGVKLKCWDPSEASWRFLHAFEEYTRGR